MTKPDDVSQEDWDIAQKWMEDGFFYDPAYPEDEMTCLRRTFARAIKTARAEERYHILQLIKQEVSNVDEVNALFQAIRERNSK